MIEIIYSAERKYSGQLDGSRTFISVPPETLSTAVGRLKREYASSAHRYRDLGLYLLSANTLAVVGNLDRLTPTVRFIGKKVFELSQHVERFGLPFFALENQTFFDELKKTTHSERPEEQLLQERRDARKRMGLD